VDTAEMTLTLAAFEIKQAALFAPKGNGRCNMHFTSHESWTESGCDLC